MINIHPSADRIFSEGSSSNSMSENQSSFTWPECLHVHGAAAAAEAAESVDGACDATASLPMQAFDCLEQIDVFRTLFSPESFWSSFG